MGLLIYLIVLPTIALVSVLLAFLYTKKQESRKQMLQARGKTVLITGCDTGFGFEAALRLSDLGVTVFAACFTNKAKDKFAELRPESTNLFPVSMDVRSEQSIKMAKETLLNNFPQLNTEGLWAVINNAGVLKVQAPDDWLTVGDYETHMDTNFLGMVRVCHAFKDLLKQAHGRIVCTSSVIVHMVFPDLGPYTCSKWAVESYAKTLHRELRRFGVSVHVVQPGGFKTCIQATVVESTRRAFEAAPHNIQEAWGGQPALDARLKWLGAPDPKYNSLDLSPVVNAYIHGVLGKHPQQSYCIGPGTRVFRAAHFLPESWQDRLITKVFPDFMSNTTEH